MKLSDTQLIILNAACKRDDRIALPLPANLKGGAAQKVVASLIAKGLVEEVDAGRGEPYWRKTDDGHDVTLVATDAAFEALGIEQRAAGQTEAPQPATGADTGASAEAADDTATAEEAASAKTPKMRQGTKQAALIAMLSASDGATINEIMTVTGWQAHTVRGAIAGALKKKLGLTVTNEKVDARGRVYRIA